MENFTPYSALAGGALIGLAAVVLMALLGRIAGIAGIAGGLMRPARGDTGWRLAFIAGLVASPWLYRIAMGKLPQVSFPETGWALIAGGLLVGFGTRMGSGCTSGHGVCGISRLSPRSMAATGLFMAAGFATVHVTRHLLAGA